MNKSLVPIVFVPVLAAVAIAAGRSQEGGAEMPAEMPISMAQAEHALLAEGVGTWNAECKIWMAGPESEPFTMKGTEEVSMMGDIWALSHFKGDMGGMPFEGRSLLTYDPKVKKYVGVWADTMTTHLAEMEGTWDAATKTMTMWVDTRDPATGDTVRQKHVDRHEADGTRVFEMYAPAEGDDLVKVMEIRYTRK